MSDDSWHPRVSRRSVLRSLGVTGLTATAGVGSAQRPPTVEIVTIRNRGEALKTKRVNENWLQQTLRAERANKRVRSQIKSQQGPTLTLTSTDGPTVGGRQGHRVKAFFSSREELENAKLPSEIEGVPVETDVGFSFTPTCYEQTYDPVKTGAALNRDGDSATYSNSWTSGGRMFGPNDDKRMLTVYHAINSVCSTADVTGTYIEQWGEDFGEIVAQDPQHDAVLIDVESQSAKSGISNDIVDEPEQYEIGGHYTKQGLKDHSSLAQHGINTCRTTADIRGIDATITCENGNTAVTDMVLTDQVAKNHDSGALKFSLDLASGQYWFFAGGMQSVNITANDGSEYSGGAAAYALVNGLSADFGPYVQN